MKNEIAVGNITVVLDRSQTVDCFDAVVTVLFFQEKLVLVKNAQRGWEFPGGHREGGEGYEDTATREVLEESGARFEDFQFLGYYTTSKGHRTVITSAKVHSFEEPIKEKEITCIGFFEQLPPKLSFTDGREQIFLDFARETGSS